jgi:hypothetical protein
MFLRSSHIYHLVDVTNQTNFDKNLSFSPVVNPVSPYYTNNTNYTKSY